MHALWSVNLKDWITGTTSGGKNGLDVNVMNTITTASGALAQKEYRFHLPATTTINKRTGAWIQLDVNTDVAGATPADVANSCAGMEVNWNGGAALQIGVGANAGAVTVIGTFGAGQTVAMTGVTLIATNKIWVRALQDVNIITGELLVALLG